MKTFPDYRFKSVNEQMRELQSDGPWLSCPWEPRPVPPEPTASELSRMEAELERMVGAK